MMSLRSIHLVFIAASIALTVMVTVWGSGMYASGQGGIGHLAFAIGSAVSGVAMTIYLIVFVRRSKQIGMK